MSAAGHTLAASAAVRPLAAGRVNIAALAAITVFAVFWQMRWGTVPDTSWLITVCERVLAGERLYIDLYETNPPFSVWLYMPPVAAAGAAGIPSEYLVHAWTYLLVGAGFLLAGQVVRRARFPEDAELARLAPAFYAALVLYPANAFSEREHIGSALFLPLLVLMAWRARPYAPEKPGFLLAVVVGLFGSVLLLVKPHYAVMVLAPAIFVCWRNRSIRPIFAVENWVIGIVCSAYLALVFLVYPEFIRDIYPVLADIYARVRTLVPLLTTFCLTMSVLMFMAWRLWPRDRAAELASVATLASLAGLIPLMAQGKGWSYHGYPALFCAVCALLCLIALPPDKRRSAAWTGRYPLLMKPGMPIVIVSILASFAAFWPTQKPAAAVVAAVRDATERPTVAMIGSDLAFGHPLTRIVEGRWAETHVSDWLGVSALYLSYNARLAGDQVEAARYRLVLDRYATGKRDELLSRRPDIISVQKDDQFWTDLLLKRYGFGQVLSSYRVLMEDDEIAIYIRSDNAVRQASADSVARPFEPAKTP
jgi:hypothetical protein